MISGQLRGKIDKLWEEFWTGGVTNPLTVIEQISFLMFARLLDMRESTEERKWSRKNPGKQFPGVYFPRTKQHLRWSHLKQEADADRVLKIVRDEVFPHFRVMGDPTSLAAGSDMSRKALAAGSSNSPRPASGKAAAKQSLSPRSASGRGAEGPKSSERAFTDRTANAFFVLKSEIEENAFDLSINRYKEIVHEEEQYDSPKVILGRLKKLESEIASDLNDLEAMLN